MNPLSPTFEGSDKARAFIDRLDAFFQNELHPLAREHGISLK